MTVDYPVCFLTRQQWDSWVESGLEDGLEDDPRVSFCYYCHKGYQELMDKHGLCENPEFKDFYEDEEDTP